MKVPEQGTPDLAIAQAVSGIFVLCHIATRILGRRTSHDILSVTFFFLWETNSILLPE